MERQADTSKLVKELMQGIPAQPVSWTHQDFQRFCENIARAIQQAAADTAQQSQRPEFGEEDRAR